MIRISAVRVNEFRGIRHIDLNLGNRNFAISGPNGTGKSGIVDAIEFALTGSISRLSGTGSGEVTVKEHGPHVDSRDDPASAYVELQIHIPSLKKDVLIRRTVKDSKKPTVEPADADVVDLLERFSSHREFVLSRREIIRYVLAEPGVRSREVQALLQLDELDRIRVVLTRIANAEKRASEALEGPLRQAENNLTAAAGIAAATGRALLTSANSQRAILGLTPLVELQATTSVRDGLDTRDQARAAQRVAKHTALADIDRARVAAAALEAQPFQLSVTQLLERLHPYEADPRKLLELTREDLLRSALEHFDEAKCPVCGVQWTPESFRAHVEHELALQQRSATDRRTIEAELRTVQATVLELSGAIGALKSHAAALGADTTGLQQMQSALAGRAGKLAGLHDIRDVVAALFEVTITPNLMTSVDVLTTTVQALPEPSAEEHARDFLVVVQERLEAYRAAGHNLKVAKGRAERAKQIVETYGASTKDNLEALYSQVEETFAALYRLVNADDEASFNAKLVPSLGKLGFDVDFYGRGFFPPGAYHSEGHQDGMGLCLYLALMRFVLGDQFTLAVLDDVLMSIDAGHRRQVCRMLKQEFSDTQFVITTHDPIWLKHMRTEGLISPGNSVEFRSWSVETGPVNWAIDDVWTELDVLIEDQDIHQAAGLLRRFLEYWAQEQCHRLRASVEFRGDAQFMLGDVLPNALSASKKLVKKGKTAAQSWGQADRLATISEFEAQLDSAIAASQVDQWQMNAAVHFNQWENMTKADFKPVAQAFKHLVEISKCDVCNTSYYVSPERGSAQEFRCTCGKVHINLLSKPAG